MEEKLPLFIANGMVDKPSDRSTVIKALVEKAGGKSSNVQAKRCRPFTEAPNGSDAIATGMAVASSGSLSRVETVRAWTPSEFKGVAEKTAKVVSAYTPRRK